MAKVSILVPIYNVETYLRECLESIVSQSLKDIEVICINDGSTDGSLAIIREFASKDPRFIVIDKPNSGYGSSMNQGLQRASGEYVGIVESDDWIEASMFEDLYRIAEAHQAEVAKSEYYSFYTSPDKRNMSGVKSELVHREEVGRPLNPKFNNHIFFQQPSIWSAIYRRDYLVAHEIEFLESPGASYQDTAFNFKVWATASKVVFTDTAYLHYRRDSEGSSVNDPGKAFCVADEYSEIERYIRDRNLDPELLRYMRACKWGAYRWNIERLNPELATVFIRHASEEYRRDFDSGVFKFQYCGINYYRDIDEIMYRPEMAIARKVAQSSAKVSIVVPVYNVEEYIQKSLDSLLNQTFKEIEIIIVDDGSTDGSVEIIEECYLSDPRVRLIHQENQGLSAARNEGVARAQAEYLAFLDSDDYFDRDAIARLYQAMTEHEVELVCGTSRVEFDDSQRTAEERFQDAMYVGGYFSGEFEVSGKVLEWVDVHVWNKLFVTSVVKHKNILFPLGLKFEDAYFLNTYAWNVSRVFFLDPQVPVHTYLRRPGAIMTDTFAGANSAKDHLRIVFLLLHEIFRANAVDRYGDYYLLLLDRYIHLALKHSSEQDHEEIWRMVRRFVARNSTALRAMNQARYEDLEWRLFQGAVHRLGKFPKLQAMTVEFGIRAKSVMRKTLRVAPGRRQGETIQQLAALKRLVRKGIVDQTADTKRLTQKIELLTETADPSKSD